MRDLCALFRDAAASFHAGHALAPAEPVPRPQDKLLPIHQLPWAPAAGEAWIDDTEQLLRAVGREPR